MEAIADSGNALGDSGIDTTDEPTFVEKFSDAQILSIRAKNALKTRCSRVLDSNVLKTFEGFAKLTGQYWRDALQNDVQIRQTTYSKMVTQLNHLKIAFGQLEEHDSKESAYKAALSKDADAMYTAMSNVEEMISTKPDAFTAYR